MNEFNLSAMIIGKIKDGLAPLYPDLSDEALDFAAHKMNEFDGDYSSVMSSVYADALDGNKLAEEFFITETRIKQRQDREVFEKMNPGVLNDMKNRRDT